MTEDKFEKNLPKRHSILGVEKNLVKRSCGPFRGNISERHINAESLLYRLQQRLWEFPACSAQALTHSRSPSQRSQNMGHSGSGAGNRPDWLQCTCCIWPQAGFVVNMLYGACFRIFLDGCRSCRARIDAR